MMVRKLKTNLKLNHMKKLLFLIPILLLFGACSTQKKMQKNAHAYFSMHPDELAKLCALGYTPQISNYKQGVSLIKTDTLRDSIPVVVYVDCPDGTQQKADCPPTKTIRIKEDRVDTLEILSAEAKAYIKKLEDENRKLEIDLAAEKSTNAHLTNQSNEHEKTARNRLFIIIAIVVLFGLGIALKFKKSILP